MRNSSNDGGIHRGDRENTGGLEARPTAKPARADDDADGMSVHGASDPELGMTGVGGVPPEDWAADTGPTRSTESSSHGVDTRLSEQDRLPGGRRVELTKPKERH